MLSVLNLVPISAIIVAVVRLLPSPKSWVISFNVFNSSVAPSIRLAISTST